MIRITINNSMSMIENAPKELETALKEELKHENQSVAYTYYNNMRQIERLQAVLNSRRFSTSDGDLQKELRALEFKTRALYDKLYTRHYNNGEFPTGLLPRVMELLGYYGLRSEIKDLRIKPRVNQIKYVLKESFPPMRYYQKTASRLAVEKGRGVLVAATGSGKSLTVARMIWELGVKTLIITPSKSITDNMVDLLTKHFGKGQVEKLTTKSKPKKNISICNIQALIKLKPELIHSYDAVFIDEFHHSSASTFQEVNVKHLKNTYYRVGLSVSGKSYVQFKKNGIITNTTLEEFAKDLRPDEVRDFKDSKIQVLGWNSELKKIEWHPLEAVHKYVCDKRLFDIKTDFGSSITLTEDHSVMLVKTKNKHYINKTARYDFDMVEKKPTEVEVGDIMLLSSEIVAEEIPHEIDLESIIQENDQAHGRGTSRFLKKIVFNEALAALYGFYVGNGYLNNNGIKLCASLKDLDFLNKTLKALKTQFPDLTWRLDFTAVEVEIACLPLFHLFKYWFYGSRSKTKYLHSFVFSLPKSVKLSLLRGLEQSDGHETPNQGFVYCTVSHRLANDVMLLVKTLGYRNSLFVGESKSPNSDTMSQTFRIRYGKRINKGSSFHKIIRHNSSYIPVKIKEVKPNNIKEEFVYDLTVGDGHTFVANGLLVHNTATNFRNDGSDMSLEAVLSEVIYEYPISQAIKDGFLIKPSFEIVDNHNPSQESTYQREYKNRLVYNKERNDLIAEIAEANKKESVIILVQQVDHGEYLKEKIKDAAFLHGEEKDSERQRIMEDFRKGKIKCLIGTSVIGEGVDLPIANVLIMAGGGKARSQVMQNIGRVLRPYPNKTTAKVYDFTDDGSDYLSKHSLERLEIYKIYEE